MKRELILALDVGTSSVRAGLYDVEGNVLPRTMIKMERKLAATDDGGAEIDADEAFQQVVDAVDNVLKRSSPRSSQIICVAISSFWHSLVGVDAKGQPTTKVFGWADTRSRDHVETLRKACDESEVHDRTGARFHSSFWPAKLMWLRSKQPKQFRATAKWLSFSDYLTFKLSGRYLTSVSMASATGIFDIRAITWDAPLAKTVKVKYDSFPEIAGDDERFHLTGEWSKRWPALAATGWFPAIGDGAANNLGAGCTTKSRAALMIGTSGAMRVAYKGEPPATIPSGLWCYRIDSDRVIMGGALSDGGGLYSWLKDNLRLPQKDDTTEAEIAKRKPDGHGLTFLPFVAGERSTGYHEDATGAVLGLRTATDAVDIVQAALESVAYRFAEIYDELNDVVDIREIIASGGALRESPVWTQIIADVVGRKMSLPDTREASSRGAVLLALESIGRIKNIESLKIQRGRSFTPQRPSRLAYAKAKKRHRSFYDLLIDGK